MEARRCSACGESKPVDQFNARIKHANRTIYHTYCLPCRREYRRNHYQRNKAYYFQKVREREARIREMIRQAKARPCADCGIQYASWQMDFDHVRGVKIMTLARRGATAFTIRKVLDEIAKCEVVCANCHRNRTHHRWLLTKQES